MSRESPSNSAFARLRRSLWFQPLAILLAVLLLPVLPKDTAVPHPFAASAQTSGGGLCTNSFGVRIIQTCNLGFGFYPYQRNLDQLESDAVQTYLTTHNLPSTDASLVYTYGRADLRNEIRGNIMASLTGIILKPSGRTPQEQAVYNWVRDLIQQSEIDYYTNSIAEFNKWKGNPCNYRLDPDVARAYGLSYNGLQACLPQSQVAFGAPLVPVASYFKAVGLKTSYGKSAVTYPDFPAVIVNTATNSSVAIGASAGAAAGSGLIAGGVAAAVSLAASAAAVVDVSLVGSVVGIGTAVAAAAAVTTVVFICVLVGVIAAISISDNTNQLNELNAMNGQLTRARNTPPVLEDFARDASGLGMYKLIASVTALSMPNPSSTRALPPRNMTDPSFSITPRNSAASSVQLNLNYTDWGGNDWAATTTSGWLNQTVLSTSACRLSNTCTQSDAFNATLSFVDWAGNNMVAYRYGSRFMILKRSPVATDKPCLADSSTGVTPATDFSKCSSYITSSLQYQYRGAQFSAVMTSAPVFTSGNSFDATWDGAAQSFTVSAAGIPTPNITLEPSSPALPSGVTLTTSADLGQPGQARISWAGGKPSAPGAYPLVLRATAGANSVTQNVSLNIYADLRITSTDFAFATYGQPFSKRITATGKPPLKLTMSSSLLLSGITFTDNRDGTADLAGTTYDSPGTVNLSFCSGSPQVCTGITVEGPQGKATQTFTTQVAFVPKPSLRESSAIFTAGQMNEVRVGSFGGTVPTKFISDISPSLSWLTVLDNQDGTATVRGTPPLNANAANQIFLDAFPGVGPILYYPAPNFTVNVQLIPLFTSSTAATFTAGQLGTFTIGTNQNAGAISYAGVLPPGLQFFDNGNGTATISGTPLPNSAGVVSLNLSITASGGTGGQTLNLSVFEAPTFKTAAAANFYVGMQNSYTVQVSGFPFFASSNPVRPGMNFTVQGLPASLTASNLTADGQLSRTLQITGNPSTADIGIRSVTITASNSIGSPATQFFTLRIAASEGDVNSDGVADCLDFNIVRGLQGTSLGQPRYDAKADVNNDSVINILDLSIISRRLQTGTVCR